MARLGGSNRAQCGHTRSLKKSPPVARTPIEMYTAALLHDPHSPKISPITHNDYYDDV